LRAATRSGDRDVRLLALKTLGEAEWKHYFGDVGSAPPLPSDMATILDGPCPFWPGKQVKDTHLLVLVPATVAEKPFTLDLLRELIKSPKGGGHKTKYRSYAAAIERELGAQSPRSSYWMLMTRDVLPDSRDKTYDAQKELVAGYASRESVPYELPSVLEAATAILLHHAREGERLFGDDPWTYTRCQEVVVDGHNPEEVAHGYPTVVGGFSYKGLYVNYDYSDFDSRGVSGLRKF
jgi:NLR family CARD domain-containing protein 3